MSRIKLVTELNNYVCCSYIIIHYSLRYCYSSRHKVISTVSKIKPLKIWIGLTGQPNTMPPIRISSVEWNMTARNKIHVHPLHRRWLIVKATLAFMPAVFTSSLGVRDQDHWYPLLVEKGHSYFEGVGYHITHRRADELDEVIFSIT